MPMHCFLVIVAVFLSTQPHLPCHPNSLLSLLSANNETSTQMEYHQSNIFRLINDVIISSSIKIQSEEITLIGNNSSLLFKRDIQPSSDRDSLSPNEASTKLKQKNTPKVGNQGPYATSFMFEVVNSTFSVSEVHTILNSDRNGICSVAGSTVRFSSSSITSIGDWSPFMIGTSENEGLTLGSTIILEDVAHHSMSGHVAPFVGVTHPQHPLVSPHAVKRGDSETSQNEWITIVGTGLCLNSQDLIGGTGPLFSFGLSEQGSSLASSRCGMRMETNLVGSTPVNMTSSSRMSLGTQLFGSEVRQLVVGSRVAESTNHDSGTGMMSPNLGGNVMCLNTSFSSCIRTGNEDTDFQNTNYTQGDRLNNVSSDVTSVTFTLCTFNTMTIATEDYSGGAAICLICSSSSLTVDTCFFHKCTCTGNDDDGGAVNFQSLFENKRPVSISHSSFTMCSTHDFGGCLCFYLPSSLSIHYCFFEQSTASSDGALSVEFDSVMSLSSGVLSISNSAFVECSSTWSGGAVSILYPAPLSLSFLQFRSCSSTDDPDARDIYFEQGSTEITADKIQFCDSTSGKPNVFILDTFMADDSFVPQITSTPTVKDVTVTIDNHEATVVVETEEAISGTMSILLDGSNVPRLVHVVFGDSETPSTIGTVLVSSGENGILPIAAYAHRQSTLATNLFPPPTVQSADATLKDWNTTEIIVKGVSFGEGSYGMEVEKGGKKWNITLTRSNTTSLTGTAPLHPSTATGRLEWATEYEVTKVMWIPKEEQAEEEMTLSDTITFTTPNEVIRIISADCSLGGDQQKSALVTLNGVKLGGEKEFNVTVRKIVGSTPVGSAIVLSGTLSGSSSSTEYIHSVEIFGVSDAPLSFDTTYLITQFVVKDSISAVDTDVTFSVPAEPARITGAASWLNGKKDELIVDLSGSALLSSGQTVVMSGSAHSVSSCGGLFNVTSTKCFVNFSIGSSEDDSHVVFGGHYDLLSVGSGSSSVIVTPGIVVDVDHPPRIASIVVPDEVTTSTFDLSVSGSNLPSGKTYTVTLSTDLTFEMSFSAAIAGTSTVKIGGSDNVQYDTSYTIQSIILSESGKEDEHILFSATTFKTPRGPTLSSISCDFDSSDPDNVKVSFSTERIPSSDFKLAVENVDSPSETVELSITFSALSSGFVVVKVYKQSGSLKYGTYYRVTKMWSGNLVAVLDCHLFSTPPEPIRITSASCSLGGDQQKSALVTLKGVKLGGEKEFNVTVRKMEGSTPVGSAIVLSGTLSGASSSTEHIHSVEIFGVSNAPLSFDSTYLITQFDVKDSVSAVDTDVTFSVPAEPSRIVDLEKRQLNQDRTKMLVFLEGRALLARTGKVSLTKENNNFESLSDVVVVDNTHCTAEFTVGGTENSTHLKYGEEYTLKGSWTELNGFHVEDGIKVTVPSPPKITKMEFLFSNTLHTGCFVMLTGTDLIVGNSLNVTLNDSLSFITKITSETEARSPELPVGHPMNLQHNKRYIITSIEAMNEADGTTLFDPAITNTTGSLPADIVIFVDSGSSSESSLFCGDRVRPCSAIEDGWKIVEGVGILTFSISILHTTTQTEQVKILSQHEVVIESGPSTKPELFVSPSLSSSKLEGEGMVDVCGGRLWMHQVDIALSDSASMIFIRMVGGDLTIEMCSLVGPKGTPTSSNIESSTTLCEWDTGVLNLVNSTTAITSTQLTHLSHGAISLKGGNLTIRSSSFDSNTPHSSSFPSLRHNIRCSEKGEIEIGSLNGGDGSSETHPHLWLSHDNCLLSGDDVNVNAPFFVPTLSSSSTSKLNKTSQAFILTIDGTTLIPCSLVLEVFEKKKDGTDGHRKPFPLTQDSTSLFNDTTIVVSLPLSLLSSLDDSLEWRARLGFGKDEISSTSFLIQENVAERRSQAVKENMKWWLPLVISLCVLFVFVIVVVIVCCRRRRVQKNEQKETEMTDSVPLELEDEKVEIVTDNRIGVNSVHTLFTSESNKATEKKDEPELSDGMIGFQNVEEVLVCSGDLKKTAVVSKDRTLYNALHSEKKWDVRVRMAQQQLVSGLKGVLKKDKDAAILRALTAHNILFDSNENVCLKLNLDVKPHAPLSAFTQKTTEADQQVEHAQQEQEPAVETNESKQNGPQLNEPVNEGVRWFAPEAITNKPHLNSVHGAVFSLGLILWEMETGCVPFAEQDAVNASRQIVTGVTPKLELVSNSEMRELISQCLCLEPVDRPDLETIESTLAFIPADTTINPNALAQC
ncbi:hypothetical protein BLNAU_10185 [Blattamonas nauphoetae]|uniref:Protein kinase domain-containing protein n=1 Tax=Blattamonas nauphoetae TaxID=2049346 RepID=A0ABQ9XTP4_9EUKA|nr:hypothetical protein BLNAU_10185 [Blattamonas nauphoetae]